MKKDMGGSAAVVGAFYALAHSVIAFGSLFADGRKRYRDQLLSQDIFESRSGKTVEIHNTDAEGRLILADALAVAREQAEKDGVEGITSVATLTGAVK